MTDFLKRILIAGALGFCISLIIFGGVARAEEPLQISDTLHWVFPAEGTITDSFGTRGGHHKGIDIAGEAGSPIFSVDNGTVSKSYYSSTYGHVVFVKHESGFETVYAHLDKRLVREGESVEKAQVVGEMGNTGRSTGTHLHFEIHQGKWNLKKELAIDPYIVFGNGEVGQSVFAKVHDPYQVVEVSKEMVGKRGFIQHAIKSGETLWSISHTYKVTVGEIKRLNGLHTTTIVTGDSLKIPTNESH
ncbi:LysM repeat protein [Bacillus pakistanensis]|uniref:LysM repeat protein n=1 Tax=Rossellomorea pakistanensis TaxID=992288 RepID=A0ABS2N973_9BACI|nr:peptidoglycan DD-metalloendopeptidase family protein [Bacillus pakistanensis]MBM7584393.1 LysM repeat protein [Bacillus pakistanensis]